MPIFRIGTPPIIIIDMLMLISSSVLVKPCGASMPENIRISKAPALIPKLVTPPPFIWLRDMMNASIMAAEIFRNSEGWMEMKPMLKLRRAPLITSPQSIV